MSHSSIVLLTSAFKAMGSDFLSSFAAFVTGEKDPRNLMLLFNLETFIIGSFKIDDNVQVSALQSVLIPGYF